MNDRTPIVPDSAHDLQPVEPLGAPPRRWNWRVMIVLFLIVLPVLLGIYFAWQTFIPPDPAGVSALHTALHIVAAARL